MQDDKYSVGPETIWPYGQKHKGTAIKFLPIDYCIWVAENFRKGPWRKACERQIATRASEVAEDMGIKVDEALEGGGYVQGRMDCSHLYRPGALSHLEPWDGVSPPFDVETDELSAEFRQIVRGKNEYNN